MVPVLRKLNNLIPLRPNKNIHVKVKIPSISTSPNSSALFKFLAKISALFPIIVVGYGLHVLAGDSRLEQDILFNGSRLVLVLMNSPIQCVKGEKAAGV